MDIIKKSYPKGEIIDVMKICQFNKNPLVLVGTGALLSQYYPADFDFMSRILKKLDINKSYLEFKKILENIYKKNNLYFIEYKFQSKDGNKHKIFNQNDFTQETFNKYFNENIEYTKIDLIIKLNNGMFKEVSIIYFFSDEPFDVSKYKQALLDDAIHYYDEKKYYKSLKRIMIAAKNENPPDKSLIILISKLFNSEVGKLYLLKNEIDAAIIFMDKYKSNYDNKLIKLFIKDIGLDNLPPENLQSLSDAYGRVIDNEGLKFYKKYKLKKGVLPPYNSMKKYI